MKKYFFLFITCIILLSGIILVAKNQNLSISTSKINIPVSASSDAIALMNSAKKQIGVVTSYDLTNGYYGNGGYPPRDTGVCSDVIWRAYQDVGKDFKKLLADDIRKSPDAYGGDRDANIDFRRVKILFTYFSRNAKVLDRDLIPNDIENLKTWQAGDIVIFDELPSNHLWHMGIISEKRRVDGVPYMIDNHGKGVGITITPLDWPTTIKGHFRVF